MRGSRAAKGNADSEPIVVAFMVEFRGEDSNPLLDSQSVPG